MNARRPTDWIVSLRPEDERRPEVDRWQHRACADPVLIAQRELLDLARAVVLAMSDQRDADLELRQSAWREGYARGRAAGFEAGYRQGRADEEAQWAQTLRPAREAALRIARGTDRAEMERRRWGPGGRERFADPRSGDFPGRGGEKA